MQLVAYNKIKHGVNLEFYSGISKFGETQIVSLDKKVCFISFSDNQENVKAEVQKLFPEGDLKEAFNDVHKQVMDAIDGKLSCYDGDILVRGTEFQQQVWHALMKIPAGKTVNYGTIAQMIGNPKAVRATGTAIGRNAVAYLIPCHRIVQATGRVGGFRWGTSVKIALLNNEKLL